MSRSDVPHFELQNSELILEIRDLYKYFPLRHKAGLVRAVDGISLDLHRGEILALVGESGCGKTTIGKLIMKLLSPDSGSIHFEGKDLAVLDAEAEKAYHRLVNMIFQDPYASMNPRFKVKDVLEEPLLIHHRASAKEERLTMIRKVMEQVKVTPVEEFMERHPHMLSGGQRQRIATARTLILSPRVIVADEPVSMIDLSTRAEILHMLKGIQAEMDLSFIYITHDISTARYFTDRICVMYLGKVMEIGPSDAVIDGPKHPYSQALIAAVCDPLPGRANIQKTLPISGEIPSSSAIPSGCRFYPRCPKVMNRCRTEEPPLIKVGEGHQAACWLNADPA